MLTNDTHWLLAEAVEFVRMLEPIVREAGWGISLTGSVLFKGESRKDLDLTFFPLSTASVSIDHLYLALRRAGMKREVGVDYVHKAWRQMGSEDTKWVEVWSITGSRVDIFVFGVEGPPRVVPVSALAKSYTVAGAPRTLDGLMGIGRFGRRRVMDELGLNQQGDIEKREFANMSIEDQAKVTLTALQQWDKDHTRGT